MTGNFLFSILNTPNWYFVARNWIWKLLSIFLLLFEHTFKRFVMIPLYLPLYWPTLFFSIILYFSWESRKEVYILCTSDSWMFCILQDEDQDRHQTQRPVADLRLLVNLCEGQSEWVLANLNLSTSAGGRGEEGPVWIRDWRTEYQPVTLELVLQT